MQKQYNCQLELMYVKEIDMVTNAHNTWDVSVNPMD